MPDLFIIRQYWQFALVHGTLAELLSLVGGPVVFLGLGSRALTRISLRFFALLLPLMRSTFSKGLVELDLSKKIPVTTDYFVTLPKIGVGMW